MPRKAAAAASSSSSSSSSINRLSPTKTVPRNYSDSFIAGESDYDLLKNRNIDWIDGPFNKKPIRFDFASIVKDSRMNN